MLNTSPYNEKLLLSLSLAMAFVLTILPLPQWINYARPLWVLLVLLCWLFLLSKRGLLLAVAFIAGIILDILQNTVLGGDAFIFVTLMYFGMHFTTRRNYIELGQKFFLVSTLIIATSACTFFCRKLSGIDSLAPLSYFVQIASSILLWPWVFSMISSRLRNQV